ncbi:MAG: ABC transporter ATP-binding protein [Desulfomonile tiedjei]|uniref:ABC transporter ATP-binding protein n=1 Tax=Desulfomonile tiedjei TaxID=2358 RepID=A0A9D6V3X7_9BACT|nr:ABC transporter ATP-binding protein [Desulfomonile tiedjei]
MFLDVRDLHSYYGKSHILQGVDLNLKRGEMVCLLGRNGVGKTTTLKSIMGMVKPAEGQVLLDSKNLAGLLPYQIARLGVGLVPEDRRILPSLTVHENLLIGMKPPADPVEKGVETWDPDRAYRIFSRLEQRRHHMGNQLSGGEQQMLSVARTLMGNPRLILVDEPTEGLAPLLVRAVMKMLVDIQQSGVTILLVEQNLKAALEIATRFYIMSKGKIVFEGDRKALEAATEVRRKYLEV